MVRDLYWPPPHSGCQLLSIESRDLCCWYGYVVSLSVIIIMSHSLLWRHCFADGRCLFKQPQSVIYHWNQYDQEISKKCRSVRPSVCPFVTLTKKPTPLLLTVENNSHIKWKGLPFSTRKWSDISKHFSKILDRIFEKLCNCIKMPAPPSLVTVE